MAASVVNFVVLTAAASSANSGVYSTSRMLFGLSWADNAPHVFRKLTARSVPGVSLAVTCASLLTSIPLLYTSKSHHRGLHDGDHGGPASCSSSCGASSS